MYNIRKANIKHMLSTLIGCWQIFSNKSNRFSPTLTRWVCKEWWSFTAHSADSVSTRVSFSQPSNQHSSWYHLDLKYFNWDQTRVSVLSAFNMVPNRGGCLRGAGSSLNYCAGGLLIPLLLDLVPSGELKPETLLKCPLKFGLTWSVHLAALSKRGRRGGFQM